MIGLVFLRTRKDASILTSAMVLTYSLYLQWSALSSYDTLKCNPYKINDANTDCMISFGLFFTFSALFVISGSQKAAHENNVAVSMN